MTLSSIARKNIWKNIRQYLLYLYTMAFSISIYFTFVTLQYNQQLLQSTVTLGKLEPAFYAASAVLMIFSAIFIWYSNSFFTRKRKKEVGLYALFGLSKKKIGQLLFYENLIIGAVALLIGIGIGILFSKLFMMIIVKLMGFTFQTMLVISYKAVLQTIGVFVIIIIVTSIYSYRLIYRFSLSELFKAERRGEKSLRVSKLTSSAAIVFMCTAYFLFLNSVNVFSAGVRYTITVILLVAGTYFFMNSLVTFLLDFSRRYNSIFLRGKNLLSITNLSYRIKGNVLILTVISLLSSVTIFAVSTTYSFYYYIDQLSKKDNPFSYMFNLQDEGSNAKVKTLLDKQDVLYQKQIEYLQVKADTSSLSRVPDFYQTLIISEQTFDRLMKARGMDVTGRLGKNEAWSFYDGNLNVKSDPFTGKKLIINDRTIKISAYKSYSILNHGERLFPLVINDSLYDEIKREVTAKHLYIYKLSNEKSLKKLEYQVNDLVESQKHLDDAIYSSFYEKYHYGLETYGLLIFIGGFLGLVFLIATGSMLYFKQLTEANADKHQYKILKKLGVPDKEIKSSVNIQVGVIFILPLLLAILNSSIMTGKLAGTLQLHFQIPFIICLSAYILIYFIYYKLTTYSYLQILKTSS